MTLDSDHKNLEHKIKSFKEQTGREMYMKIALAQMEVIPGQPQKNVATMLRMIAEAKQQHVDLIAFPEMCIGGYLVGDKFLEDTFCADLMEYDEVLRKASEGTEEKGKANIEDTIPARRGIAIAYGNIFVERAKDESSIQKKGYHPNKDGRSRKYNAVRIFQNGKPVKRVNNDRKNSSTPFPALFLPDGMQPKTLLPNYRFFDDERYFFSTEDIAKDYGISLLELLQPFMITVNGREIPIGFEVCEDFYCEDYRKDGKAQNVTKMLIDNGAEYIINISASPWTFGKNNSRDKRIAFLKQDCGDKFVPFFYVNCTGAQNNGKNIVTFDGGSTVYNANGQPVALSKAAYQEELMIIDTEKISEISSIDNSVGYMTSCTELSNRTILNSCHINNRIVHTIISGTSISSVSILSAPALARTEKPYIAQKLDALITGIRHLKNIQGSDQEPKFLLGMSGGVDSSVAAALLTLAVGKNKVLGINMPTQFNSEATKSAAKYVADQLGITYMELPIGDLTAVNEKLLERYTPDGKTKKLNSLQKGNIAAKIRGTNILSNLAAIYGALFTNNGNKLEVALGYATLYGDVNGAIAPLADLTKTEVYELGKYLNLVVFGKEVIPAKLFPDQLHRFPKDGIIPSAELEENQIDPMKFGYHDALLMMLTDYQIKTGEDFLKWFTEGKLHQEIEQKMGQMHPVESGFGYQLMQRWGVHDTKTFVEDLDWFLPLATRSIFKRVQSPPIIITSKTAYGYDRRESMLSWQPTQAYERLKKKVLAQEKYIPKR